LRASGGTDAGLQREVNEDRYHCDADRGVFMVIDGVGGQAAGGKAADVAQSILKEYLGRDLGSAANRLRDGITAANNDVYRLAATRAEWDGMACVLTAVLVRNGKAAFGHVGDTRLYKLRGDSIEKLTRDHSPVGEREDANEISERQAMRHPRRNEVYRDVGSEFHDRRDRDFIDVGEVAFEPDAALLICSDGLTDLVDSVSIARTVSQWVGDPDSVVRELIAAANAAGGKDNVTVVYVEGEQFAASNYGRTSIQSRSSAASMASDAQRAAGPGWMRRRSVQFATIVLLVGIAGGFAQWKYGWTPEEWASFALPPALRSLGGGGSAGGSVAVKRTVAAGGSIADAMRDAPPGSEIVVEPGEYREQVTLVSGVRLVSQVPGGAIIRLPATVPDAAEVPAVVARNVSDAEFVGFRVSGDSATPLPVGILVQNSTVSIRDVEITGATRVAVEFEGGGTSALMASDIRDNPGPALIVRDGATPRVSHNSFERNGRSDRASAAVIVQRASPTFSSNVFVGMSETSFTGLSDTAAASVKRDNWFITTAPTRPSAPR
jgi:serine/threonine protein phosphatase PrpC